MAPQTRKNTLARGRVADVAKAVGIFSREADEYAIRDFDDFTKIAMDRSLEAAYPSILALGRRLRGGGVSAGSWRVETADTGNPWQVALSATHAHGWGFIYVTSLKIRIPEGRLALYAPDFDPEKIRSEGLAQGMTGDELEMDIISAELMAEIGAKEKLFRSRTLPDGVDADLVDKVDGVLVAAFRSGDRRKGPVDGHLEEYVPTLDNIAKGAYVSGMIVKVRPDHLLEDGRPMFKGTTGIDLRHHSAAYEAMKALRNAFGATGLLDEVRQRGMEVADRDYETVGGDLSDIALAEAAQGCVFQDGGLAAEITADTCANLWEIGLVRNFAERREELLTCIPMLARHGHTSRENEYQCNDGRTCMWLPPQEGPIKVLMRNQHGTYGIEITNGLDPEALPDEERLVLTLSRIGHPDLAEDDFSLPGIFNSPNLYRSADFLGTYSVARDGACSIMIRPHFSDRSIRDINGVTGLIETVAVCLEEDYGAEPPSP